MPSHPAVPKFALTCYLLSGREIVVQDVTRDTLVVRVTRFLARALLLDTELAQVFLVSGVKMMPNFDTFDDWGIREDSNRPFVNVVVTGSQNILGRDLYQFREDMDSLRRQWAEEEKAMAARAPQAPAHARLR
jgi:hypothetical protein